MVSSSAAMELSVPGGWTSILPSEFRPHQPSQLPTAPSLLSLSVAPVSRDTHAITLTSQTRLPAYERRFKPQIQK